MGLFLPDPAHCWYSDPNSELCSMKAKRLASKGERRYGPCPGQGLRFCFWKKIRWPPETVYRPKFRGFPVISTGKSSQIQNSEISVFRSEFRCILPEFRCFSPKNDGNGWKMMENYVFMKKLKILAEFGLIMSILIDYNTQYIINSSTQWEIKNETHYNNAKK